MIDPEQILRGYEGTLAEAERKSEAIRAGLATLLVTERSADGQITVTVNDAGNLVDLRLGNALQGKDGTAIGQEGRDGTAPRRRGLREFLKEGAKSWTTVVGRRGAS